MDVCVDAPRLRSNLQFPVGSVVKDVLTRFVELQGGSSEDFYVIRNGRVSDLDDLLQNGSIYHLQPRMCGGKGGFGSMLRALGAQIEKTTNREACRDLSGRRLRDVNHEKEMAEWLKKQADRDAEKEQRRLDRLQRKLSEPGRPSSDRQYQQQCHDLLERLEDSVLRGLQASSSGQVKVDDVAAAKRSSSDQSGQPQKKKAKTASARFWTGVEDLDDMLSSEDSDDEPSTSAAASSSSRCGAVAVKKAEPDQSSSSSEDQGPAQTRSSEDQVPSQTRSSKDQVPSQTRSPEDQGQSSSSEDQEPSQSSSSDNQEPAQTRSSEDQEPSQSSSSEGQEPAQSRSSEDHEPSQSGSSEDHEPSQSSSSEDQEPTQTRSPENPEQPEPESSQDNEPSETRSSDDPKPPETTSLEKQQPPETRSAENLEPSSSDQDPPQQQRPPLDLASISSVEQLESAGLDVLKEALMSRGMKCGGSLSERAARLFSVRGLRPEQISPALLAKPGKSRKK